ncbi:MAG: hypothetical protein Kow0049_23720 [Stanieria sp.]
MVRLKPWQWVILATPIASIVIFLLIAAGWQINHWGINWIWAIFTLIFVPWRWLLVKWTNPAIAKIEAVMTEVNQELESTVITPVTLLTGEETSQQVEAVLQNILQTARNDLPIWEDWNTFWQRCQNLVINIAHIYHPEVKYPLLNIYIPQAYGLIRGTVDDLDLWMQKLSPVFNQVTVGQAYQTYEVYQKLEPSARKLWQAWNWMQWLINPAVALARQASQRSSDRATQQLLINLGQSLREVALRNLCRQAVTLYSGKNLPESFAPSIPSLPKAKTQTLQNILQQAEPTEIVAQKPVNILLVGRTGAGKSSLINTLFQSELAEVDVLPSTDQIKNYHWQASSGESLTLWDTPGYEQINRNDFREQVLDYAINADLLLLVTPALDPALQMDLDFLKDIKAEVENLPTFTIVTQVDRLRPIREWNPPYNWQSGELPKEKNIREAVIYRNELLGEFCDLVLPVVTSDPQTNRKAWGIDALSFNLLDVLSPAKQLRLARFLRNLETRSVAAAKIIDRYTFQMATTQGLTTLLKTPVLQFISTLSTGSPTLAYILAEQIPVEQLPVVIGKLQMAYDLFNFLNTSNNPLDFDLLSLWPVLLENPGPPERNAWAFGHALVEYWTQNLTLEQLRERFEFYFNQGATKL